MRLQRSKENVLFIGFIGAALFAVLVSQILRSATHSQVPAAPKSNVIVTENENLGTSRWQIPEGEGSTTQIQAYASATSISPGQRLTFYVSTQIEGTDYSIGFYRLGWYGGLGGRLMSFQDNLVGHAQGYYDSSTHQLINCTSCHVDPQTGLIEANWKPSYTLTVPSDWTTGVYLAKLTDANHMQTYVPFDVRGNAHSTYVLVTPDTTSEAYNNWGGSSLYEYQSNNVLTGGLSMGEKVSFDRPYVPAFGANYVLLYELNTIRWLEREGYDVSYISNVDLHDDPAQLLQHRAYLSIGHDEYWTKEMRDGVVYARDHGVGLAFLGADSIYWQMRFEPDSAGVHDRTVVCYKVSSGVDLNRDPFYGKDNSRVTTTWRDPLLNLPENAVVGVMFSNLNKETNFPWQVSPQASSPLLVGTGLQPGRAYGCGLVGYEWDKVYNNGFSPAGLQVLSVSHVISTTNHADVSNSTYYIAPSGAMVFATGSVYWARALDSYRFTGGDPACIGQNAPIPPMEELMAHVMAALVVTHPSLHL
jgi:hypothetical protein